MGFNSQYLCVFIGLLPFYGLCRSDRRRIKIWISITEKKDIATAIGSYPFQSVCTMLASSLAGLIWYQFGSNATFITVTGTASLILFYFVIMTAKK
jgi:hypothetical protein